MECTRPLKQRMKNNMDDQRDVQNPKRNKNSILDLSGSSAVAMEIKRKKIRQSTLFQQNENASIEKKLDFELRMREGAYKLLLACSNREQILNASKNLLTCNARIKAYMGHMQKTNEEWDMAGKVSRNIEERVPCRGTVALSGLRIPLMWKDQDHFNNRGSSRRVAIFCLMKMGSQVFDTKMAVVDRTITDVCFDEVAIFQDAVPGFKLRVELWSCALEEELNLVNTPKKLAKKLRNSLGKSAGKKLGPLLDTSDPDTFLQSNPVPVGAKYTLLAYSTMRLPEAEGSFQSHSLVVLQNSDWSSWLPLYGNLCCRLVAQPVCMTQSVMTGYLNQKQSMEGFERYCRFYCILSASTFSCYFSPEEVEAKVQPTLCLAINKDTRIRVMEKQSGGKKSSRSLSIINPSVEGYHIEVFTADTREELDEWQDALHQHIYDQSQWLHCCQKLMKIEVVSPRKPSLFLTKQADSVYDELSINSPGKLESITDIIHSKIEETDGQFLIGHQEARQPPMWSTLFDGTHTIIPQKASANVLSQSETYTPCSSPKPCSSSTPNSGKKRRAPPPPMSPYTTVAPPLRPERPPRPPPLSHLGKENTSRPKTKTGRPSLDAKFSAIIQQLQHNNKHGAPALGRKNAPLALPQVDDQVTDAPAPRSNLRKSFRERMNFKANI
ncbi:rhotekin-2 isoform X2 [Stigmatopora nigra]